MIFSRCHPELVSGSYSRLDSDGILKQVQDDKNKRPQTTFGVDISLICIIIR